MKVECYLCGDMCFDGCKDESKEMIEHYEYSDYHQRKKAVGFGKFLLFGCDMEARWNVVKSMDFIEVINQVEHCGGYIP